MKHLFTLLLLTLTTIVNAANISGSIKDATSGEGIPFAHIVIPGQAYPSIADADGNYQIADLPEGEQTLKFSALGYEPTQMTVAVKGADNAPIVATMKMSLNYINSVEVKAQSMTDQDPMTIAGSAHYIDHQQLSRLDNSDINRSLATLPGIQIQEEDGFGLRPNIGLRGTGTERSSKITLMEDGVLMAPAPYSAPAAYYFPTAGRMHGIEVVKGSSQIQYGPYTNGGAINLISTPIPSELAANINISAGNFGTRKLHANVGNAHEQISYLAETYQYRSNGFKTLDNGGSTGFDKQDYMAKLAYRSKADKAVQHALQLKAAYAFEHSDETYLGLTQADFEANPYRRYSATQNDEMNNNQSHYILSHSVDYKRKWQLSTQVYRTDFHRNWYKLNNVIDANGEKFSLGNIMNEADGTELAYQALQNSAGADTFLVKANNRTYYAQGVQTKFSTRFFTKDISHRIQFGVRVHQDEIDRFQWVDAYTMNGTDFSLFDAGTPGTESNRVETATAFSEYIQYQIKRKRLTLQAGARAEQIMLARDDYGKNDIDRLGGELKSRSNEVMVFIPGLSANYQVNEHWQVLGGVHRGFSPPGNSEGAEAEFSINYEAGTRFMDKDESAELIVFVNDYHNLLGTDLAAAGGTGDAEIFEGGEALSFGVEAVYSLDPLSKFTKSQFKLPINLSYTFTQATFRNAFESDFEAWGEVALGDELPYFAKHHFALGATLEHDKFGVSTSLRQKSAMRTTAGQGDISQADLIEGHWVMDLGAYYQAHEMIQLYAKCNNVSNNTYVVAKRPAGLRPGLSRAFHFGIQAKF